MHKRTIAMLIFSFVALFGLIACGSTDTSSSTPTPNDASTITPISSPALSPTPSTTSLPLQVIGISTAVNPGGISNLACGSSTNFQIVLLSHRAVEMLVGKFRIPGIVTFAPGETSKTIAYTMNNFVVQLNSASALGGSISISGVCKLPGPFQVVGLSVSMNPASIAGIACGTNISVTYTATIAIAPDSNAGTVQLVWTVGFAHFAASINFAPAQTIQTIALTQTGTIDRLVKFPRPASISSTSPNSFSSATVQCNSVCK